MNLHKKNIAFALAVLSNFNFILSQNEKGGGFIENKGQVVDLNYSQRKDILFTGEAGGAKLFFRQHGISYVVNNIDKVLADEKKDEKPFSNEGNINKELNFFSQRIDVEFEGCNDEIQVVSKNPSSEKYNYFFSYLPAPIKEVKAFSEIDYQNVYNNIDISCYNNTQKGFKYDIIIKPNGNVNDIILKYQGADEVVLEDGKLKIKTAFGELG